jgi:hypothetical protein
MIKRRKQGDRDGDDSRLNNLTRRTKSLQNLIIMDHNDGDE